MTLSRVKVDLFEHLTRLDTLDSAWERVRSNNGCAGGDGVTVQMFQPRAAKELILLSSAIRGGRYLPGPFRLFNIAKKSGGTRPLAIPSVVDRVLQTACAITLTPILEPTFEETSFGYRPGRGVADAVQAVTNWRKQGYEWVVEADIVRCFERIPHEPLLARLTDALAGLHGVEGLIDLVAMWVDMAGDALQTPGIGIAQGSPLSPILCNLYLDGLDDSLARPGIRLVRYADDFVILCKTKGQAEKALDLAKEILDTHGLELKSQKTRIVDFDRGFEFLGHMFVRSFALKQVADSEEDMIETLRIVSAEDQAAALAQDTSEQAELSERANGYDRANRTLYLMSAGRRLALANQSFAVQGSDDEDQALILSVPHQRIDRIEIGPRANVETEALRHALATDTDVAFVDGHGMTQGALISTAPNRYRLHLAQAEVALDPSRAAALSRRLVDARLRNHRALLKRLNRRRELDPPKAAALAMGRLIRKLPHAETVEQIMGLEGAGGAAFWPAFGLQIDLDGLAVPYRRERPAGDPLDAALNYLTALLERDVRSAVLRAGLHPGFGALHSTRDYGEACVWDLMEPFRAPLVEAVVASEFNNDRLHLDQFEKISGGGIAISWPARRRLIEAYEQAASRLAPSPYAKIRRRWRALIEDAARAYGKHCLSPDTPFILPIQGY